MNNEEQIVQQLASTIEPHVPISSAYPEPQPEPNANNNFLDKMLPEERLTQMQLLDYLSIPTAQRHDPVVSDYVNTVYAWARDNAQSGDFSQLLRVISEQEGHMGIRLKENRLQRLAEYVKISNLRKNLSIRERNLYG